MVEVCEKPRKALATKDSQEIIVRRMMKKFFIRGKMAQFRAWKSVYERKVEVARASNQ